MAQGWPRAAIVLMGVLAPALGSAQGWVDPPAAKPPAPAAQAPEPPPAAPQPAAPPAQPVPSAPPPRNVEVQPQAAPPAQPPAPATAGAPPQTPPQQQQAAPAQPPAREPAAREPDVAARPEPEPRRQAEPRPAPRPAPAEPAVTERPAPRGPAPGQETASLEQAAQRLTTQYLQAWSAPNDATLAAMPAFYAARVEFHGRSTSLRSLLRRKERFVRRWPDRTYTPLAESMRVSCAQAGGLCTVRTLFDFAATDSRGRRRSAGTGQLDLVVAFAGTTPLIVSESSQVVRRGRLAFEQENQP